MTHDQWLETWFSERLYHLRRQRKISARKMSLELGQNDSYINRIETGKALPSMKLFFCMCRYLCISPAMFFDEDTTAPELMQQIDSELRRLQPQQLEAILYLLKRME